MQTLKEVSLNFDISVLNVGAILSGNKVPVCILMLRQQVLNSINEEVKSRLDSTNGTELHFKILCIAGLLFKKSNYYN